MPPPHTHTPDFHFQGLLSTSLLFSGLCHFSLFHPVANVFALVSLASQKIKNNCFNSVFSLPELSQTLPVNILIEQTFMYSGIIYQCFFMAKCQVLLCFVLNMEVFEWFKGMSWGPVVVQLILREFEVWNASFICHADSVMWYFALPWLDEYNFRDGFPVPKLIPASISRECLVKSPPFRTFLLIFLPAVGLQLMHLHSMNPETESKKHKKQTFKMNLIIHLFPLTFCPLRSYPDPDRLKLRRYKYIKSNIVF